MRRVGQRSKRRMAPWKRLRLQLRRWAHHERQYRDELDEQRLRFGLERASRELRSLGCGSQVRNGRASAPGTKPSRVRSTGRRFVAWLRARGRLG